MTSTGILTACRKPSNCLNPSSTEAVTRVAPIVDSSSAATELMVLSVQFGAYRVKPPAASEKMEKILKKRNFSPSALPARRPSIVEVTEITAS
jgi:hypothetical protein